MPFLLVPLSGLIASTLGYGAVAVGLQSALATIGIFAGTAFGGALLQIGLSFGLSYLANALFRPKPPSPEDVQQSSRQPLSPRYRHYGRVKTSGSWVFAESKAGSFYKVLVLGQGRADAIEEYWVDTKQVTLNGAGMVTEQPWFADGGRLNIQSRLGLATETSYADLTSAFPEWTNEHRLDGVTSLFAKQFAVSGEYFYQLFPNSINTLYRVVIRAALVKNPITNAIAWSDNASAVVLDYCTNADGARMPAALFDTPDAIAMTRASFTEAAASIPLKAGGAESQWRLWGSYSLAERPSDVLGRMLSCCDGTLRPTRDGGIGIEILKWQEPTVVIDDTMITGFDGLSRGRDIMSTANVISATYLSPDHDYQSTEAQPWYDDADIADRGEIELSTSFIMAPSHGQCRRLMKRTAHRANPNWRGTFELNVKGLAAFGDRLVRIKYPLFGIDEVFEVADFRFKFGDNDILLGAVIQVSSLPQEAVDWDEIAEEGDPEPYEVSDGTTTIPDVAGFNAAIVRENISGVQIPFCDLSWTGDGSPAIETEGEYKKTADSAWTVISVTSGASVVRSPALTDNTSYDFRVRHRSLGGRYGAYSSTATINVVADNTAPGAVTAVSRTGGSGQVTINWTSPNSANYVAANIRRNTTNNEAGATLVRTEYGPVSTADTYIDGGLAAGTYYYWIKARNPSGVESASVATGSATVT